MKSISLSKLPVITDPHAFFNAKKVLGIDLLNVDAMDPLMRLKLQIAGKVLQFGQHFYMPIALKGQPQNFFLNTKDGIPYEPLPGMQAIVGWDRNLNSMLAKKKIYDLSYHLNVDRFTFENDFLYNTFVLPYEGEAVKTESNNIQVAINKFFTTAKI